MGEEIEWHESDRKYVEEESNVIKLLDLLYDAECKECGRRLTLVVQPDPDSLCYTAECDQCELHYRFDVTHVRGTVSDANL